MKDIEVIASGYGLIEGPTIDAAGRLCFSDVTNGGVYALDDGGDVEVLVPKRRYVGGMCEHVDGGLVISGRDISHVRDGKSRVLCTSADLPPAPSPFLLFSDICADNRGRVLIGVPRGESPEAFGRGQLAVITAPGVTTDVPTDAVLPNGITVSGDGAWVYQADSETNRIIRYDLSADNMPRMVDSFPSQDCTFPDGLATDVDGGVWAASYGGGCVVRYTAAGAFDRSIPLPGRQVTNLCFGRRDPTRLFVVTADNTEDPSLGGCIFALASGVEGAPTFAAAV